MEQTSAQQYIEILRGFSPEEKQRLPLEFELYGDDFKGVIGAFADDRSKLESLDTDRLNHLIGELETIMARQLRAAVAEPPKGFLIRREWDSVIQSMRDGLEAKGAAIHRLILREYFFLLGTLELYSLVQVAVVEAQGLKVRDDQDQRTANVRERIVKIFQGIDRSYEENQEKVAELTAG